MAEFVTIAETGELADGQMKKVLVGEVPILVANVGGRYYATQNTCPHMGGDLSRGKLQGTVVTCPRHHSQFDVRDGRVVRWTDWGGIKLALGKLLRSPRPLATYPIKTDDTAIMTSLEPSQPSRRAA